MAIVVYEHLDEEAQEAIKVILAGMEVLKDYVVTKSGAKWGLYEYTSMAARVYSVDKMLEYQTEVMTEFGDDLIYTSSHAETSPLCKPWQGRVYSVSGENDKYPPFDDCLYKNGGGIFHPNCRHYTGVYFEGVTRVPTIPEDKLRPESYKVMQEMRYNESMIRYWQRRDMSNPSPYTEAKVDEWKKRNYDPYRILP